jgi:hypothetical protein
VSATVELSHEPLGYVLHVSAVELGHLQAGLIDLAKFYERNVGGSTDEWFRKQASEVLALHAAIDPSSITFEPLPEVHATAADEDRNDYHED